MGAQKQRNNKKHNNEYENEKEESQEQTGDISIQDMTMKGECQGEGKG